MNTPPGITKSFYDSHGHRHGAVRRKSGAEAGGVVTLGWIREAGVTLFYLERMKDALDEVFERHPATRLKIVADEFFDCAKMPVIKKWNYEEESRTCILST